MHDPEPKVLIDRDCRGGARMSARALRQYGQAEKDECRDPGGSKGAAEREASLAHRFIKEIADRGAEWAG